MTRGIFIGEIIDNLSNLNNQINLRCSLGLMDLNKFSEDFFAKLLNKVYGYNLKNLNGSRSNEPGLDIGDELESIAFQVTSQATSAKVNNTLEKITAEQRKRFEIIMVLIIGQKQSSYSGLDLELVKEYQYTKPGKTEPEDFIGFNIIDIKDILRDVVTLDLKDIHEIYKFIKSEVQNVILELEVPNNDGAYPTSFLSNREITPESKAKNGKKILNMYEPGNLSLKEINAYFDILASIPRVTREVFYFILDEGRFTIEAVLELNYDIAVRKIGLPESKFQQELKILERSQLIFPLDEENPLISSRYKNEFIGYMLEKIKNNLNLRQVIVNLDFTKLDE